LANDDQMLELVFIGIAAACFIGAGVLAVVSPD
jgi:hypothetical protein